MWPTESGKVLLKDVHFMLWTFQPLIMVYKQRDYSEIYLIPISTVKRRAGSYNGTSSGGM